MADANRRSLQNSNRQENRQQRGEQPDVPGATGGEEDVSPEAALEAARKRRGKTGKHTSDDTPAA
jgi:hypothetical protein